MIDHSWKRDRLTREEMLTMDPLLPELIISLAAVWLTLTTALRLMPIILQLVISRSH